MDDSTKTVTSPDELIAAAGDSNVRRIVVKGGIAKAPSVRLQPGQQLTGDGKQAAVSFLPGVVEGLRIQRVFEGRAQMSGKSVEQIRKEAMAAQSLKRLVDPKNIAALAVFLASYAAKSISGQMLPIDNDMQQAS